MEMPLTGFYRKSDVVLTILEATTPVLPRMTAQTLFL
jgi:hypothetical protein